MALLPPAAFPLRSPAGDAEIFSIGVDGTARRNISQNPSTFDTSPVVSPSGARIAFLRTGSVSLDLWVMNADGSGQAARVTGPEAKVDPAWAPNSKAIAFTSATSPPLPFVRVAGWTRTEQRRAGRHARFSPDGRALVFEQPSGIAVLRRTRTGVSFRRLLRVPAVGPVWSPAGARIAYERVVTDSVRYIAVMNANGTRARRLALGSDPVWSARGLIAFVRGGELFVVRPDGRGLRKLTSGPGDGVPTWSRDGGWLAFVRNWGGNLPVKQIWVIGADGSGLRQATQERQGVLSAPSWSRDGRRLYYAARGPKGPPPPR